MANLRGGSVDKQLKDAFLRLAAFGQCRHNQTDHLTHSDGLATKREMYLRDWGNFVKEEAIYDKVNQAMTADNMDRFLEKRLEDLSNATKESYIRGWSSLIQGLTEENISTHVEKDYFNQKMDQLRDQDDWKTEPKIGKSVDEAEVIIQQLYEKRYATGFYAEVMYELGIRASESIKLLNEPDRYIVEHNGELVIDGLIGKGNNIYDHKEISGELAYKIQLIYKVPSYSTFYRDLREVGITAHGFRYSYAKEALETKLSDEGQSYHDALREVSKELNHHREEMTKYYISRA
jgi:hypothetical protein